MNRTYVGDEMFNVSGSRFMSRVEIISSLEILYIPVHM